MVSVRAMRRSAGGEVEEDGCGVGVVGPADLPVRPEAFPRVHEGCGGAGAPAQGGGPDGWGDAPGCQARVDVEDAGEGGADYRVAEDGDGERDVSTGGEAG